MPRTGHSTLGPELVADTTVRLPISDLRLASRNPRKGNVGAIAASLRKHGQYRPITANIGTHTGRKLEVLKGNHNLKAFRALAKKYPNDERWATILVHLVDVDEQKAHQILLVDNATSAAGKTDAGSLHSLLGVVGNDLDGLGYTADDLDALTPVSVEIDPDDLGDDDLPDEQHSGRGQMVISYSIVFDDTDQRKVWTDFVNGLKRDDPDSTPAERLTHYIEDVMSSRLQETEEA